MSLLKNQSGQSFIEMTLMIVLVVGIAITVSTAFRKNEFFASLVNGPWRSMAGLIQNGTWGSPESTMLKHPNQFSRVNTVRGDTVK